MQEKNHRSPVPIAPPIGSDSAAHGWATRKGGSQRAPRGRQAGYMA
jgi:hypothetical protein